ncbi:hypothetical protein ACOSQ3_017473 [Xanthoceras sorbifolium]
MSFLLKEAKFGKKKAKPRRYQSGVMGKSLSNFYKFSSCCTMSKLDDSSGALSAAAVAKETLKDRVIDGKVDHLGGQV